ncbi:hypothetical protein CCACVL1_07738 [Corchorus capsularis]|uniref:HAT C-terminal dimerisation domain-containing protein n=1 Tax=Corchorus capsularis TaxID=210143 RepID=A0A1R3J453_COCAP|nr:hypothetical protein CCACVL1_07738 [Corchorus capsularis]
MDGLQELFLKDCPSAYYVHCLAHRVQLALVAASRELQDAKAIEIANMLAIGELETGKGLNKISTVKRAGETRWSSHFSNICSVINMFAPVKEIMGTVDILCQYLQQKSQDIVIAMHLVSSTKALIQKLRDDGWDKLLGEVIAFCGKHDIDVPNMNSQYVVKRIRPQQDGFNMEHHYRVDIFNVAIDSQLSELNSRFNDQAIDLLTLSSGLVDMQMLEVYFLADILIRLLLTLPLSTTTTERAFSTMKIVKIRLRNKMEDGFLVDNLVVYIEREIAEDFDLLCTY